MKIFKTVMIGLVTGALTMGTVSTAFAEEMINNRKAVTSVAAMQVQNDNMDGKQVTLFGHTFSPIEMKEGIVYPKVPTSMEYVRCIFYVDAKGKKLYKQEFAVEKYVDQYDIKVGEHYAVTCDSKVYDALITAVYEDSGTFFGTNRMISFIDLQTGKSLTKNVGHWSLHTYRAAKIKFGPIKRADSFWS